jgi:integrase
LGEAHYDEPSRGVYESMARRRFQDPKPKRLGKWWYLLYRQDEFLNGRRTRKRKRAKLAPAATPEREVRKIAAEFLRPMNQGLISIGSATKFQDYVETVYKPTVMPLFVKSVQDRYESVIKNHLMPVFEQSSLRDMTPLSLQRFLSGMAKSDQSHESLRKMQTVLSSILGSAVRFGLLVKNPAEGLKLPPDKKGRRVKAWVTPEMFCGLLELTPEPYATMVYVAVYTGLRVSELIGLRWRNVHEDSITIEERCCRGDWGRPKSEASNATIAVNRAVIERIHRLRVLTVAVKAGSGVRRYTAVKADGSEDLVFQSLVKGGPMRDNNILTRHIKPAARKLGIGWVNWQVLRRSHATWLKLAGADVKDAQAQMRHSRVNTMLDIYQQFVPESQRKAVDKLTDLTAGKMVN